MWQRSGLYCKSFLTRNIKLLSASNKNVVRTNVSSSTNDDALPTKAEVVICGGGVMGAAVAYHLAMVGLGDQTVLIESSRYIKNCN